MTGFSLQLPQEFYLVVVIVVIRITKSIEAFVAVGHHVQAVMCDEQSSRLAQRVVDRFDLLDCFVLAGKRESQNPFILAPDEQPAPMVPGQANPRTFVLARLANDIDFKALRRRDLHRISDLSFAERQFPLTVILQFRVIGLSARQSVQRSTGRALRPHAEQQKASGLIGMEEYRSSRVMMLTVRAVRFRR